MSFLSVDELKTFKKSTGGDIVINFTAHIFVFSIPF